MGYCITTYTQDYNKYLIKIYRNNELLGYRYVSERNANELLQNKYQKLHNSQLKIAKINVICSLTPDNIPILPKKKILHKSITKILFNIVEYVNDKRKYYKDLKDHIIEAQKIKKNIIVMGDFNVSPEDIDIGIGEQNMKRWLRDGKTSFQPEERDMWNSIKDLGFVDSWRFQNPNEDSIYSWFDYRSRMFDDDPKRGLRIDHIMITKNLVDKMSSTGIDYEARAMEKPSDHCPIWVELKL